MAVPTVYAAYVNLRGTGNTRKLFYFHTDLGRMSETDNLSVPFRFKRGLFGQKNVGWLKFRPDEVCQMCMPINRCCTVCHINCTIIIIL